MPIYEYQCLDCQTRFEALRGMARADEPIACPQCQSERIERQVTTAFAHSGGRIVAGGGSCACGGCSGGACGCGGCSHG